MTKREHFIQLISYGPSKLPLSYVLEAFDHVMGPDIAVVPALPVSPVTEKVLLPEAQAAEDFVRQMNAQLTQGPSGMALEEDQENAEALSNLSRVTEEDHGKA
jgi:hypothetical protein